MNVMARTLFARKQRGYVARGDQLDITDEGRNVSPRAMPLM
jgi:hypothetical protein